MPSGGLSLMTTVEAMGTLSWHIYDSQASSHQIVCVTSCDKNRKLLRPTPPMKAFCD